jgi:hypothetical protein
MACDNLARIEAEPPAATSPQRHWAFQPVRQPAVPAVRDQSWVRTPIDAFVLARLEQQGLKPAAPADRRALLRRAYFDLIGLPPTLQEQETFLKDPSPDAFTRVVDDLLSRPQYGERWARHWFDVVRYAESNGYEHDGTKPNAWRYRDYVIDAFNTDMPYDRFLTEQLAGDEIDGADTQTQIATTFLRLGTWDAEPADPKIDRYDQLDDVLGTTATAFLGLTLRCARCHDHKFEPFSQVDYYRLLAVFEPLKRSFQGRTDLDREVATESSVTRFRIDQCMTAIRDRLFAQKKTSLPAEALAAFQVEESQQTEEQQELVKKFKDQLTKEIREAATAEENAQLGQWEKELTALRTRQKGKPARAYIWYEDGPKAPSTFLLARGNPYRPKKEVTPGIPVALVKQQPEPPQPRVLSTGRRLWLANWLTRPDNPLVARVMVNRVWQAHFGRGIVPTANDFGTAGEPPSHPELLDWLAANFLANGWQLKPLHRLIVLSNAYQMASTFQADAARIDPKDLLLWRFAPRRLEAEEIRDGVLAVSGELNPQMGGRSVCPPIPRAVQEGQSRPGAGWAKATPLQAARRSVYIFAKRSLVPPELDLLDAPDTTSSCEQRTVSTTGPQALTCLNGEFMNEQARHLASRLVNEAGAETKSQIERAFQLAWCRPPRPEETQAALQFLARQRQEIEAVARTNSKEAGDLDRKALEAFCLVLLNTNEFVYLD